MQFFTRLLALSGLAALAQAAPVEPRNSSGRWIIQLAKDADASILASHLVQARAIHARSLARRGLTDAESGINHEFSFGTFHGYSAEFDETTVEELRNLPEVSLTCTLSDPLSVHVLERD